MLAKELITEDIPPLKHTDSVEKAIAWMDDFKVTHMPVLKGVTFLGVVEELQLLDAKNASMSLAEAGITYSQVKVFDNQHVFEVAKMISDHHLTLIPVLDASEKYIGNITLAFLMHVIAEMSVVSDPGGIIELELNVNDYSLSEVARIVEMNDAKILGSFITSHPDSTKLQLTFKVNRNDLAAIIQTFNRYNYTITGSFDNNDYNDDMKDRFDSFMNYLKL